MKKLTSLLLCLLLLASFAMSTVCAEAVQTETEIVWDENEETILLTDGAVYGEGEKEFTFEVSHLFRYITVTVRTDAETVGAALTELNIIAGDESEWGLYVKTVNGITADYNTDGSYWAFYIDGEYALTGVDATEITEGSVYTFAVEGAPMEEDTITLADGGVYGKGEKEFTFVTQDEEGNDVTVLVRTDAETVGAALVELCIIAGDESEWGLYVKTVNGITADYNTDGSYWAFYIDGEYALTGVDATEITEGAVYTFKVEK